MGKLTEPSVERALRIVEERLIRMRQRDDAARLARRERDQLRRAHVKIRALRRAKIAADIWRAERDGSAHIGFRRSSVEDASAMPPDCDSSQPKGTLPMTKSMLADVERCIRYEILTTADGIQYLCMDSINDDDYRPNLRLLNRDAAEAWVAERRKIGSGTISGLAPDVS